MKPYTIGLLLFLINNISGQEINYYQMGQNDADSVFTMHKESNWSIDREGMTDKDYYGPAYNTLSIEQKKQYEEGFAKEFKKATFAAVPIKTKAVIYGSLIMLIGAFGLLISLLL